MFSLPTIAIPPLLRKWGLPLASALLLALILSVAYCKGQRAGKSGEVQRQQVREIETQKNINQANEQAADQRVADTVRAQQQQKELTDALAATSDPDRQRSLRGCLILRQQGRDISNISACR